MILLFLVLLGATIVASKTNNMTNNTKIHIRLRARATRSTAASTSSIQGNALFIRAAIDELYHVFKSDPSRFLKRVEEAARNGAADKAS